MPPHGKLGILWGEFLKQKEAKITRLIKGLLARRRTWSYKTRLIIFKTFIRSTIDYCLPIITLWFNGLPKKDQRDPHASLDRIQRLSLEFIFDTDRPRALLEGVSGLGDYRTRSCILEAALSLQLKSIAKENPLNHFLRQSRFLAPRGSILHAACTNQMAVEYSNYCKDNPLIHRRWTTFARQKLQEANLQLTGCLQHYIRPRARFKQKADSCLFLPLAAATQAIQWRSNKLFMNKNCPDCNKTFNRAHLATCNVIPKKFMSICHDKAYQQDLDDIFKELSDKGLNETPDFYYTPLDFLLNEKRYEDFKELIEHIDALLNTQACADSS